MNDGVPSGLGLGEVRRSHKMSNVEASGLGLGIKGCGLGLSLEASGFGLGLGLKGCGLGLVLGLDHYSAPSAKT